MTGRKRSRKGNNRGRGPKGKELSGGKSVAGQKGRGHKIMTRSHAVTKRQPRSDHQDRYSYWCLIRHICQHSSLRFNARWYILNVLPETP